MEEHRIQSTNKKLQVVLLSEHLRNRLHYEQASLIKDRRYHFRVYPSCFIGRELVDWLINHLEVTNRDAAVQCMNILHDYGLLHHVCDDHRFKDQMLFYRFCRDDGTKMFDKDIEFLFNGLDLYYRILSDVKQAILIDVYSNDNIYKTCFLGRRLVDWLVFTTEVQSRENGVEVGSALLKNGIIKQLPDGQIFEDNETYYQFVIENHMHLKLMDVLDMKTTKTDMNHNDEDNYQARETLEKLNIFKNDDGSRHRHSSVETPPNTPPSLQSPPFQGPVSPRPVVLRKVSVEELEDSRNPYVMTKISVSRDAVGYGFVVRGDSPVYVQTVDPSGPGAAAGVKVRQYVYSVNGKNVLRWCHKKVAEEILNSPRTIELVIMNHFRGS